ncbi:MAG: aminotransferase class V-fold PLP-dependent enzyme [Bacteroidota bacterium]
MTLDAYRSEFDLAPGMSYLNHAAAGVLSRRVREAVDGYLAERAGGLPENWETCAPVFERTLHRAATLIGAEAANIEFMPNTTAGLNLMVHGYPWQPGDRVALPGCEFPANQLPWLALESKGVRVDRIPHREGTFSVEDVEATLRPETRVLAVSWVQFLSGFTADLAALGQLCQDRGLLFCVDGIQGLGALQIDAPALGIDVLATGGHKWLGAMKGGGFVYVADRVLHQLEPVQGWLNGPVDWDDLEHTPRVFHDTAERFRLGTPPIAQIFALDAALGLTLKLGSTVVETAVRTHASALASAFEDLGLARYGSSDPAHGSGIVTISVDDPEGLEAHLRERDIWVAMRSRKVRFAPHAHTRPADVERAIEAVAEFTQTTVHA